jgi:NAD(P)-dependent dehydrogenase (short-subunit alcohol dehydrogenase family)
MTTSSSTALVTGGSRGLGLGIATALADAGHRVVVASRSEGVDVTDEAAVAGLVARSGPIDIIVNAAGAPPVLERPDEMTWEAWRTPIDVDVRGVFNVLRAAAPVLREGGTVVNVASGAVVVGSPLHASYSAGQAALLSLSRCFGAWLAPRGVVTHSLSPSLTLAGSTGRAGAVRFGAGEGLTAEEWYERRFGEEMLTPEAAGAAVLSLAGEREGGDWVLGTFGLERWAPLEAPAVTGWGRAVAPTG